MIEKMVYVEFKRGKIMEIAQEEKAALLERAVINSSVEELSKLYDGLGYVEMSAPALGLACRFRGLAMVKALVEKGAVFDFPSTEEIEIKYHCHIGEKHASYRENYRTNYSLYLLRSFRGGIKGACCLKGMKFAKNAKMEDGKQLPFLADEERIEVLNYLIEKKEALSFQPEEMLFYAIFAKDAVIYEELKKRNITLSEKRIYALTEGVMADGYWFEFGGMTRNLAEKDYIRVMQQLYLEMQERPFRYTEKLFGITKQRFHDIDVFAFFLAHFNQKKMKKYQIIRDLIDENALDALAVVERGGWLAAPRKRDEMIAYATQVKNTEALAWLLDFKNRTADLDAEQEKAETKMMRELSAAPDSVTALRGIWNYKKREDGTLIINGYKGTRVEVIVPERIGKSVVTAIGKGAFADCRNMEEMYISEGVREIGEHAFIGCGSLTSVTIPGTVEKIGAFSFDGCKKLEKVHICEGVQEIGENAFGGCISLKTLTIPGTVKVIKKDGFMYCKMLESVQICEGVEEIEEGAFAKSQNLKEVYIPKSVRRIRSKGQGQYHYDVFEECPNLTVICPEGSRAEAYCKGMNIKKRFV